MPGVCNSVSVRIEHAGACLEGIEFSTGSFGRWKTLSLWMFWLIDGSRSVVVLATVPGYPAAVQSGLLPGKQGYPPGSGTGSNRTAVPFYGFYNFGSN